MRKSLQPGATGHLTTMFPYNTAFSCNCFEYPHFSIQGANKVASDANARISRSAGGTDHRLRLPHILWLLLFHRDTIGRGTVFSELTMLFKHSCACCSRISALHTCIYTSDPHRLALLSNTAALHPSHIPTGSPTSVF